MNREGYKVKMDSEKAIAMGVPVHTVGALERYINDRIATGGFLNAVLCNDLIGAISLADEQNLRSIPEIVKFLYNNVPMRAWRTKEKVKTWLKG